VIPGDGKSMDFTRYWAGRIVSPGPRQFVMIARKPLAEIAVYSVAMPVTVGLCLWVLLGPLHVDRFLSATTPKLMPEISATTTQAPVPDAKPDSEPATVAPVPDANADPEPAAVPPIPAANADSGSATVIPVPAAEADTGTATVVLFPGDDGRLLAQMRGALIGKGYSVGPVGADANDDTLAALEAFQSNNALPVQPKCDQQCRAALGLPDQQ
jgi:hypothetical protein